MKQMKYISLFKKMSILMSHMSMCKLLYSLVMSLFLCRPQIYSFLDSNSPQVQVSYLKSTFCFLLNVLFSFYCTKFSMPWLICSFSFSLKKQQKQTNKKTKAKNSLLSPSLLILSTPTYISTFHPMGRYPAGPGTFQWLTST